MIFCAKAALLAQGNDEEMNRIRRQGAVNGRLAARLFCSCFFALLFDRRPLWFLCASRALV